MRNLNHLKKLIKIASKLEDAKQYHYADKILIKIAQETPEVFKQGTEMKPGTPYEVQGQKVNWILFHKLQQVEYQQKQLLMELIH